MKSSPISFHKSAEALGLIALKCTHPVVSADLWVRNDEYKLQRVLIIISTKCNTVNLTYVNTAYDNTRLSQHLSSTKGSRGL